MMIGGKLSDLTASDGTSLKTYQHCIAQAICNPPLPTLLKMGSSYVTLSVETTPPT